MKFVHLHVHSHYSLLDGLSKIPDLVAKAKEQGAEALALTDHGVMYGIIEFYETCKKVGIKPILGTEVYIVEGKLEQKENIPGKHRYFHLTLLAKNYAGYLNLMKITTKAHIDGYYYKPRIDHEFLEQHSEGIIALSGCLKGELPTAIVEGNLTKAKEVIQWHQKVFKDDYYIEVQYHPNIPDQIKANIGLKAIAKEFSVPLIASTDSHYIRPEDAEAHEVLLCVQTGAKLADEKRFSMKGEIFDLTDPSVIAEAFADTPEVIANTQKVADKCNVELELDKIILPSFDLPDGETGHKDYLRKLVDSGVKEYFGDQPSKEVLERIEYELGVIHQMQYETYFLVVADLVGWAKAHGVLVGPGRGSGAASLVSYVLKITDINPLDYDLIFERFLNPSRISMPDFDIDFADDRRGEVINYVVEKYGKDRVSQIVTFGTMAARASLRDTARTMGMSYTEVDRIAKLIPFGLSLSEAISAVDELKDLYAQNEQVRSLIDLAKRLEGVVRHTSVHAAGVVIADKPLVNYTPLQVASKGDISYVTQYSMFPIEKLGLLKIDFLGLKNLTIIKNTLRIIRKTKEKEIDISKIPLTDPKVFELFARGETTGVFQFESEGMKRNLQELRPTVFTDIIAMVALYRPGPMALIPDFIERKHGTKRTEYLHPRLEPILKETYGIAVYQEQVLRIARDLCGFSLGEADILRKAIGKKIATLLMEQKKKFIEGGVANGISKGIAEELFEFVEPFAEYGFNKAHATSYALIAYQTAYLKRHFPSEFLAALMTSDQNDLDKVAKDIAESERFGSKVLPPSVNESFTDFAVVKETGNIRFGLNVIKNVGRKVSDLIVEERGERGPYKDIADFLKRVPKEALNKKVLESLSKAGALEEFGDRKEFLENVDTMLEFVGTRDKQGDINQIGIFGEGVIAASIFQLKPATCSTEKERLSWEKELLGTFVSKHPLKEILPRLKKTNVNTTDISSLHEDSDGKVIKLGGMVSVVQKVNTKNGEPMAFLKFEDLTGSLEVIVFPKILQAHSSLFTLDKILIIDGKVNVKDKTHEEGTETIVRSEAKVIAESVIEVTDEYLAKAETITNLQNNNSNSYSTDKANNSQVPTNTLREENGSLIIRLPMVFDKARLLLIKQILEKNSGDLAVQLEAFDKGRWRKIKTITRAKYSPELEKELDLALS
ncbi:DNA polymerase III subunit alpha [Patescibacteria group bacterium]|nr:DNA polymerase III subunit alpha [Patescibacteria group bacterium]